MENFLNIQNLRTTFYTKAGPLHAVDGVSYELKKGETLGIVGESGCGKSVTSYSILGLLQPPGKISGGKIFFKGQDLAGLSEQEMRKIRGKQIAIIFQEPMTALNPVLKIGDQISEQILAHENLSKLEARKRSIDLLHQVGIPSPEKRIDSYPHQLSGGMRQRAMIAMALSCNPEMLIADEPTTALDVTIQAQILDLLARLQEKYGMAVQFITHNLGVVSEITDRIIVMYAGKIVEEASSDAIFHHPMHPYTVGLLSSIPKIDHIVERLPTIEGFVPSLLNLPKGCRFQNRCPHAKEQCKNEEPLLKEVSNNSNHKVACFYPRV